MPHILLRFMAIENKEKLKLSRRVASVWVVISMAVAILIGVVGYSVMKKAPGFPQYATNSEAESVVIDVAKLISSHGYIPAVVGGIILAGILASTMSTADSQLLAAASAVSQNIVAEFFKVKISQKASMWIARITVIVISIIAVFLALNPDSSVFRIVSFAWGGFGACFGPAVLLALFWKRSNKWGILAGMISGGAMIFIWKFGVRVACAGSALDIYELLPAFILNLVVAVVVSLVTKAPEKEVVDTFDQVVAEK
jgi:sodium/proline symporter